ncbi:MAG: GNAT family N-acetyltransferase [Candidatus Thiodiazotropha sp. (ex Ctena orbiculata)]|nr:GNAT family N-acetyltransferase [Candidatus Thiodiazotropha taylori]
MANNDLLIKLYEMNFDQLLSSNKLNPDITVRKPIGTDRRLLIEWAEQHYPDVWLSEIETALANRPGSCYIAQQQSTIIGFACYDATALGYFGPLGVIEAAKGQGVGRRLTLGCLREMHLKGYGYAIVGMPSSSDFYRKIAPIIEIPDSDPGFYRMTKTLIKD